jgi:hypothetical protein
MIMTIFISSPLATILMTTRAGKYMRRHLLSASKKITRIWHRGAQFVRWLRG